MVKQYEVVNCSDKARPLRDLRFPGGVLVMEPWTVYLMHWQLFHKFCGVSWLHKVEKARRVWPEKFADYVPDERPWWKFRGTRVRVDSRTEKRVYFTDAGGKAGYAKVETWEAEAINHGGTEDTEGDSELGVRSAECPEPGGGSAAGGPAVVSGVEATEEDPEGGDPE